MIAKSISLLPDFLSYKDIGKHDRSEFATDLDYALYKLMQRAEAHRKTKDRIQKYITIYDSEHASHHYDAVMQLQVRATDIEGEIISILNKLSNDSYREILDLNTVYRTEIKFPEPQMPKDKQMIEVTEESFDYVMEIIEKDKKSVDE